MRFLATNRGTTSESPTCAIVFPHNNLPPPRALIFLLAKPTATHHARKALHLHQTFVTPKKLRFRDLHLCDKSVNLPDKALVATWAGHFVPAASHALPTLRACWSGSGLFCLS